MTGLATLLGLDITLVRTLVCLLAGTLVRTNVGLIVLVADEGNQHTGVSLYIHLYAHLYQ